MNKTIATNHANPYLPLWEHLPDGEPRVFEDPQHPGQYRVYIIGSHDMRRESYCGPDIHAWSASIDNLNDWRDEGAIFTYAIDGQFDVMYAPDLVEVKRPNGTKDYYLYPHSRGPGREAMVCKGPTPIGPFTPINLTADGRETTADSILGFDPAVYIETITDPTDPDFETGFRAYGYWGFQKSYAAELDPHTLYSLRPGTAIMEHVLPASSSYGHIHDPAGTTYPHVHPEGDLLGFNFFEAASMRRIGNKYIWVFSGYSGPEYGLPSSNSTLRYAYGDSPLGPWKDGGVLVDARSVGLNATGDHLVAYYGAHNTHGSIQQINDQWYCFYHRPPRGYGFARQAMVAPIHLQVDALPVAEGGKVTITGWAADTDPPTLSVTAGDHTYPGAEMTSEGFNLYGLNPYHYYSAGIACFLSDPTLQADAWDIWHDHMSLTNVKAGDIIGYKYFGFGGLKVAQKGLAPFTGTQPGNNTRFHLFLTPQTTASFTLKVMLDGPWENSPWQGQTIAEIVVPADTHGTTQLSVDVSAAVDHLEGKHALYLVGEANSTGPLCDVIGLGFSSDTQPLTPPVVPNIDITLNGEAVSLPTIPVPADRHNGLTSYDHYELTVTGYTTVPTLTATADVAEVIIQLDTPATLDQPARVTFDYLGVMKTYTLWFETWQRTVTTHQAGDSMRIQTYSIKNDHLELCFLNVGGAITKIAMAADDYTQNLVLNHADVTTYQGDNPGYVNALVGRTSNRIKDGTFDLAGQTYTVDLNNGPNNLHGGFDNLTHAYYDVQPIPNGYQLSTRLAHQPNGFPGDLEVVVTYTLEANRLTITYTGTSHQHPTLFNPTQHAYFNLSGNASETINSHVLQLDAGQVAEIDTHSSFTTKLNPVTGTRFDFQTPVTIDPTHKPASEQFDLATGYDHLFILNPNFDQRPAAVLTHPASTRQLTVYTSEPALQFYAGNYLDTTYTFEGGIPGQQHLGLCLETHKIPFDFPSHTLEPGVATQVQTTTWVFSKGEV